MRTRRRFSAEFKAKVALEAIKGDETVTGTVKIPTSDNKTITVTIGQRPRKPTTIYTRLCGPNGAPVQVNPDKNFLELPSCVVCTKSSGSLFVNPRLRNNWLKYIHRAHSHWPTAIRHWGHIEGWYYTLARPRTTLPLTSSHCLFLKRPLKVRRRQQGQTKGQKSQFIVAPAGAAIPLLQ
jgi:hypothetical protein